MDWWLCIKAWHELFKFKEELLKISGFYTTDIETEKRIKRLLDMEFIAMTIPEKFNSRLQKYCLVDL
jgi:hypothetical protein